MSAMSSSPITKRARIAEHAFLAPAKAMVICSSLEEAGDGLKIGTHDGKVWFPLQNSAAY